MSPRQSLGPWPDNFTTCRDAQSYSSRQRIPSGNTDGALPRLSWPADGHHSWQLKAELIFTDNSLCSARSHSIHPNISLISCPAVRTASEGPEKNQDRGFAQAKQLLDPLQLRFREKVARGRSPRRAQEHEINANSTRSRCKRSFLRCRRTKTQTSLSGSKHQDQVGSAEKAKMRLRARQYLGYDRGHFKP